MAAPSEKHRGRGTGDPGTGKVEAAESLDRYGEVTRDDVAAVIAEAFGAANTIGKGFDLLNGETSVKEAIAGL